MLIHGGGARDLSFTNFHSNNLFFTSSSMLSSSSLKAFHSLALSASSRTRHLFLFKPSTTSRRLLFSPPFPTPLSISSSTQLIDQLPPDNVGDFNEAYDDNKVLDFDVGQAEAAAGDLKHLASPPRIEVKELEELPEQWRRTKIAWLCKELPAHKPGTLIRLLNAQRKWMTLENAMYIAVHFMRVRENDTSFRVYKWMQQQHWFRFDFDFATRLADYMGRERKFSKCREIFNDIINQGKVPSESTFHILTVAYLSSSAQGCLEEACGIYNRMIQFGGYKPRLSLHNSLFRSLVSKPGGSSKYYLKQAEFIFHNLVMSRLEIHKDIYSGLIWLHSYQDKIDTKRLQELREEMKLAGLEEGRDVLVSILRAYSKEGNVEEVERTWLKLIKLDSVPPPQASVYRMEVYAKVGKPMKSLDIFKGMQEIGSTNVVAYHKIIEVMSGAQEVEIAETLVDEFVKSGLKPLMPAFIDLMNMFLSLDFHDKLEATFVKCLEKCRPNRTIYNIYLDSLAKIGNHGKASEIFNQMLSNESIGVNSRSSNTILSMYLNSGDFIESQKIYNLMCQKRYAIEPPLMEKLDVVLSMAKKVVKKPISLKLRIEQREILIGLLLGGLQIESDKDRENHAIHFEFNESSSIHSVLRKYIYDQYHEWLNSFSRRSDENEDVPHSFSTIAHSCFGFYADQFWPKGRPMVPKLIHRWLSPRVLAYWYMYGGHRTISGDIFLRLKGADREEVEKIVKIFKAKSLECRVKRKKRIFWIGFQGSNSQWFWKLVELYILDDLKDLLRPDVRAMEDEVLEDQINFESGSNSGERAADNGT